MRKSSTNTSASRNRSESLPAELSSTQIPSYKQHTPIRSSNIVVAGSGNRNISELAKQLKANEKLKNSMAHKSHQTSNIPSSSQPKKKVNFPYPKFSRSEYQQQAMRDNFGGNEEGEMRKGNRSLQISRNDIEVAFQFFDVHKRNKLTAKDLRNRLKIFYPHLSNNEYKFLVSDDNFTIDKLEEILTCDVSTNFDPYKEAFKVFDPQETGYIDIETLSTIMSQLGYGTISSEDQRVLISTADVDGDGRVSLEDFKNMLNPSIAKERKETVLTQELRALGSSDTLSSDKLQDKPPNQSSNT